MQNTRKSDKFFISYPAEPFQQAVVWPTYTQPQTTIQAAPHLLMPPMATAQPPPPLLLGASDYLSSNTTLHQVGIPCNSPHVDSKLCLAPLINQGMAFPNSQHTQTVNSTRLVALASDNGNGKRKMSTNMPTPIPIQPAPTLIKIEDSATTTSHCNPMASFEPKSTAIQTATITTALQPNDISQDIATQLSGYYQTHGLHGNLIQIAPHTTTLNTAPVFSSHTTNAAIQMPPLITPIDCRTIQTQSMPPIQSPPDVTVSTMSCLTPITETFSRSDENLDSSGVSTLPEGNLLDFL